MAHTTWVKSPDEIKKIEERLAAPAFLDGRTLTVTYLTRPEIIRAVLPPPLEPVGEPLVSVGVGTFGRSNCVGGLRADGSMCGRDTKGSKRTTASRCRCRPMSR